MSTLFDSVTASYTVRALADPQVVSRVLGFFAQNDLVPDRVRARRHEDRLTVAIEQPAVSEHQASIIAEKIRSLVLVEHVAFECRLERASQRLQFSFSGVRTDAAEG